MKILPIILIISIILMPVVYAERPTYSLPPSTFDELPPYPDDLEEIKELFALNKINITQLSPEYYLQPEFYPTWFDVCEKLYDENRTHYGVYGFNIYPSLYTLHTEKGKTIYLTAFLSNGFGICVKTGVSINITYDKSIVKVERILPKRPCVLLEETHPKFSDTWIQPLVLKIDVLKNQNTTIKIYNSKPSDSQNELWEQEYGTSYATAEKFTTQVSKLRIQVYTPDQKSTDSKESQNDNEASVNLLYIVIIVGVVLLAGVWIICRRGIERKE